MSSSTASTLIMISNKVKLLINFYPKRFFNIHSVQGPTKNEVRIVRKELYEKLITEPIPGTATIPIPVINNPAVRARRSKLFTEEKERQLRNIGRVEKIQVEYEGLPKAQNFLMNKFISTSYQCTQHISDVVSLNTVVAEVNGELWDLHRPLEGNCKLKLLTMSSRDEDLYQVNRIFWRSCTAMLGSVLERIFRDHIYVELHSFPSPNVKSGSFFYDVDIKIPGWTPNSDEMRVFSGEMLKLSQKRLPFERLEVSGEMASEIFSENQYKREQIPKIISQSDQNKIVLYRIGDFVEISKGPMMAHTGLLGKCTITSLFPLKEASKISDSLYRIQGVAIPSGFHINHYAYGLIEKRAKKFNDAPFLGLEIDNCKDYNSPQSEKIKISQTSLSV